jgi:hypothetical protein
MNGSFTTMAPYDAEDGRSGPPAAIINGRLANPALAPGAAPTDQLKASLRELLATVLDRGFGIALEAVEQIARGLEETAARGGLKVGALFGGAQAAIAGGNPVWGAIKGAVAALSPGARAALIVALILAVLLLPVTVVLVLLALIVLAIIAVIKVRSAS